MLSEPGPRIDHAIGDATGIVLPAHEEALRQDGADFLTRAFRAFGTIEPDDRVNAIRAISRCPGGSTGSKLFLTVDYAAPDSRAPRALFVKFSRDFTDDRRDCQRDEMAAEARFAALSRRADFPIAVPRACFADYAGASGTGIVITERIAFGQAGIEPHRAKCLDHRTLDDPLPYYRAIVTALARLAGAHKAGALGEGIDAQFPFDPVAGSADPIRIDGAGLDAQLADCADFAARFPRLLPPEIADPVFLAAFARDARRVLQHEQALQAYLRADRDLIALCHWNAHVDNGWFWRGADGTLRCGLIDWGRVGQISLGSALWGALSAAHPLIWDRHIDALLALFATEYRAGGGPLVDPAALKRHLALHMMTMGVARVLAFPEIIRFRVPGIADASGPDDPMIASVDPARNCLHIYTILLQSWRRWRFGALLDELVGSA